MLFHRAYPEINSTQRRLWERNRNFTTHSHILDQFCLKVHNAPLKLASPISGKRLTREKTGVVSFTDPPVLTSHRPIYFSYLAVVSGTLP